MRDITEMTAAAAAADRMDFRVLVRGAAPFEYTTRYGGILRACDIFNDIVLRTHKKCAGTGIVIFYGRATATGPQKLSHSD